MIRLNKDAYKKLIQQDINELDKYMPNINSIERNHIIQVLQESVNFNYPEKNIIWEKENDKFFGLDYSFKKGTFKNYTFDIRYDYDGMDPKIKPKGCGLSLIIYFKGKIIESKLGYDMDELTKFSQRYLEQE